MIAALAAAAGVYYTGRSLEATRTQNTVAEQGQLTDRFTKAVDQLDRTGADHLQARLGGIYALERLARDSPRDHPIVVEVLTAFIRTTAQRRPLPTVPSPPGDCAGQAATPDVQAALTVLGRRDTSHDQTTRIDLSRVCLGGADLRSTDFHGADFSGADLSDADLRDADFSGAEFRFSALAYTDLRGADLSQAVLFATYIEGASLVSANLMDANLDGAYFIDANLRNADLRRVKLRFAFLIGVHLGGADLRNAVHDQNTRVKGVLVDGGTQGAWW